jgi:chromosomal replication initiation ATPase DnaA
MTLTYQPGFIPGYGLPYAGPKPGPQGRDLVRQLAREIAAKHGLTPEGILGRARDDTTVMGRQELAWRLSRIVRSDGRRRFSMPQIGRYLDRDHTTIIHAIRAHEKRMGGPA